MDPADFPEDYEADIAAELEVRDYYTEKNVFWVPFEARWQTLRDLAQLPPGSELPWQVPKRDSDGRYVRNETGELEMVPDKMRTVGWLIDNSMEAVERENAKLKNVLNKEFARTEIESHKLADLIAHFSDTNFSQPSYNGQVLNLKSKDILGHVYEYFLGQFALAEGKKGGQYYTPKSIVTLIVEMLQPFKGRVYDPAMGSGGFFVQSEEFIAQHGGNVANTRQTSIYGQESNPTTWRLAAMNMAIRGIDFEFKQPGDTLQNDLHPDLRADYVMANPPFNMKEWWSAKLENDPRWIAGTPPQGNANFAWLQHMLYHLSPTGSMALLLANGSMSSNTNNEGEIRKKLIEDDYVECMVALPGQLFTNTQIPACIWFLTRDKANGFNLDKKKRDRRGQFLFIDARQLGYMKDRVLRDFREDDIQKVADTFHAWQHDDGYADTPGFCYSASLDDIRKHEHVLTPGRYVGTEAQEEDGEVFADKMTRLTTQLAEQFGESARLEGEIKKNLAGLGYDI
ncbi:putative type I restriction enzymeP M protein [compost metagenome]